MSDNTYLSRREIKRHLGVGRLEYSSIETAEIQPALLDDAELDRLTVQLDESIKEAGGADQFTADQRMPRDGLLALYNHAAAVLQERMPNAGYTVDHYAARHAEDEAAHRWSAPDIDRWREVFIGVPMAERSSVPTVRGIKHAYHYYPTRAGELRGMKDHVGPPQLNLPHPGKKYRPAQAQKESIPIEETSRLWKVRKDYAAQMAEVYAETGVIPPRLTLSPATVTGVEDFARQEGYFDWAAEAGTAGTLFIDWWTGKDLAPERVRQIGTGYPVPLRRVGAGAAGNADEGDCWFCDREEAARRHAIRMAEEEAEYENAIAALDEEADCCDRDGCCEDEGC